MREIKFRAWLKEEKIMINVSEIDFHGEEVSGFDESDVFYEGYGYDYAELMQYTGLKDKNGKKIYEGDIVFAEARFDCANMVVVWDKGSFVLVPCEKYKNYISGCGYKDIRWLTKTVIGNIYENPELMEEINNE